MSKLTHFDQNGLAHMVDVGAKAATQRQAVAEGRIVMQKETLALILAGSSEQHANRDGIVEASLAFPAKPSELLSSRYDE